MKQTIFFITLFIALGLMSCKKDKTENPIEFKFQLLDTLGNEKTVFNEGENIVFSFTIENTTDKDVYFRHGEMNLNDFFRLFKLNTIDGNLDIGKPYESIFCEYIGALKISSHSILKIEIPWFWKENQNYGYIGCPNNSYHSNNIPLNKGNYSTFFSSSFIIDNIQTETKYFKIQFLIK